jgi:hypothetical protein
MNGAGAELCRWHAVPDELALQQATVETILANATQAIHERGRFQLVLAGGNSPRGTYQRLSAVQTDWSAWHIYFADERCLPAVDSARDARVWGPRQGLIERGVKRFTQPALEGALSHAAECDRIIKGVRRGDLWDEMLALGVRVAAPNS